MHVRARVITGPQDELNFFFEAVRGVAVEAGLIAALIKASVTLDHREITVGRLVVIRDACNRVVRAWPGEGPAHSGACICFRNCGMAVGTDRRIHVVVFGEGRGWSLWLRAKDIGESRDDQKTTKTQKHKDFV